MHKKMDEEEARQRPWYIRKRNLIGAIAFLVIITTALSVFYTCQAAVTHGIIRMSEWMDTHIVIAIFIFAFVEILWILLCIPTTPIELLAGFIFGVGYGILVNQLAKFSGCCIAFVMARRCVRGSPDQSFVTGQAKRVLDAVDIAFTQNRREGIRLLLLIQLAFLPVALKNYGLSLGTSVIFSDFALTTFFGEIPSTVVMVAAGSSAADVTDVVEGSRSMSTHQVILLVFEAFALLFAITVVGYKVSKILNSTVSGATEEEPIVTHSINPVIELSEQPPQESNNRPNSPRQREGYEPVHVNSID